MATSLQLKLLSAEEVSSIYDKCLDHLSSKGVKVEHPQALRILDKAGAWVDFDNQQVRFPKDVIEMALRKAPHALTLAGSNYSNDIVIPDPRKTFYTITEAVPFKYHDPDSKTYPDVTLAHLAEWAQLVGALGEINSCGYLTPADVPAQTADIHALKVLFENTSKPIHVLPYSLESVEYLFQLALVVAGSAEALKNRPIISIVPTSLAPFVLKAMDTEAIIQACHYGVPIHSYSVLASGGNCPVTIAGTVLLSSIEILAQVVTSQLIEPGTPVIGGVLAGALDMLTGRHRISSVEGTLGAAATVQFIKEACHIPMSAHMLDSDSCIPDGQSMNQKTLGGLLGSMAGSDILAGAGNLGKIASPVQLILDNSLVSIIKRVTLGIKVDDETLAWKDILDTIPGGHFIDRHHTLQHCREALQSELFVYEDMDAWKSKGSKDLYTRAIDRYRELKRGLQPRELPKDVQREMNLIVKRADERLGK